MTETGVAPTEYSGNFAPCLTPMMTAWQWVRYLPCPRGIQNCQQATWVMVMMNYTWLLISPLCTAGGMLHRYINVYGTGMPSCLIKAGPVMYYPIMISPAV